MSNDVNRHAKRTENRLRRNKDILEEYNRLYNIERIRHDDCIKKLSFKFYLAEETIMDILSSKD